MLLLRKLYNDVLNRKSDDDAPFLQVIVYQYPNTFLSCHIIRLFLLVQKRSQITNLEINRDVNSCYQK